MAFFKQETTEGVSNLERAGPDEMRGKRRPLKVVHAWSFFGLLLLLLMHSSGAHLVSRLASLLHNMMLICEGEHLALKH